MRYCFDKMSVYFVVNATLWNVIQRAFPNECKERDSKAERNDFEKCLIGLRGEG